MKLFLKLFFSLLLFNILLSSSHSKDYYTGNILSEKFEISKRLKIPLSEGEWIVARYGQANWGSLTQRIVGIIKVENNTIVELIEVYEGFMGVKYAGQIDHIVNEIVFNDKHDGCYERPEYYILARYHKGTTHNCLTIRHMDTQKELYNPDGDHAKLFSISYRQYLKNNPLVKFPPIMLESNHSYYSRLVGANWYDVRYFADPKIFNSPKITKFTEETSEFHKFNISDYPEHKKIMDLWVSITANRHQEFEKMSRSKKRHMLKLDSYNPIDYDNKNKKKDTENLNIAEQIKKLNDLYKSGVLTEEEFKKAKKRILN
tara:strand:- start:35 stop:982 length:948 start_codon:yes stop_codon:yes gene_type:complete